MEIMGGIAILLGILVLLAALGVATIAAFMLMAVLGLVTELSFKRLFFLSFALGLLAPILLGGAVFGALEDGTLQDELRVELHDSFPSGDALDRLLENAGDQRDPSQQRARLEQLLEEQPELREVLPPVVLERLLQPDGAEEEGATAQDGDAPLPDEASE